MSAYHGPQGPPVKYGCDHRAVVPVHGRNKGVARARKAQKRLEAEQRASQAEEETG